MMSARTALVRSEARLELREPAVVFWMIFFPALLLAILAQVPGFRAPDPDLDGLSVLAVCVPVDLAVAAAFMGLYVLPATLASYRERGVLRRLATTPVGPVRVLLAHLVVSAAAALPETLQRLAEATPLGAGTQAMQAMQAALSGAPAPGARLLVLLAWTVVPAVVAVRRFRWQ